MLTTLSLATPPLFESTGC